MIFFPFFSEFSHTQQGSYPLSSGSHSGGGILGILVNLIHLLLHYINLIKNMFVGLFSGGSLQESTLEEHQPPSRHQKK